MNEPRKDPSGNETAGARICPQCGSAFVCGLAAAGGSAAEDVRCWCFDLPAIMPVRADTTCLCRRCLLKAMVQQEFKQ